MPIRRAAAAVSRNSPAGGDQGGRESTSRDAVGVAAGLDKNGRAVRAWGSLGFGFAELGTVTADPQPGNEKPRLIRLPGSGAIINRMGFNNAGAEALAARLDSLGVRRGNGAVGIPIGVSIGKSQDHPVGRGDRGLSAFVRRSQRLRRLRRGERLQPEYTGSARTAGSDCTARVAGTLTTAAVAGSTVMPPARCRSSSRSLPISTGKPGRTAGRVCRDRRCPG